VFPDIDKDIVDKFFGTHRIKNISRRAGTQVGEIGIVQGPIKPIDDLFSYRFHKRSEFAWDSPNKDTQTK